MIHRDDFLSSLLPLSETLTARPPAMEEALKQARLNNQWFTDEFVDEAIEGILTEFLDVEKCAAWLANYPDQATHAKRIALIMAGNIPLVGFHDLFCVLASGHNAVVKLSEKDAMLLPYIIDVWKTILPSIGHAVQFVDRVEGIDAVIATGSNNSLRYFEYYFKAYPHVFRRNRNGVAVLSGNESERTLKALGDDIFLFFGLGCRNVSKVIVPEGYDFNRWQQAMANWEHLSHHNKYRNNLDYNYAIYLINQVPHLHLGHVILKEDEQIASRIGCVYYHFYKNKNEVVPFLQQHRDEIQCVISETPIEGWDHIHPGQSQRPTLRQYADGVDTMAFLYSL